MNQTIFCRAAFAAGISVLSLIALAPAANAQFSAVLVEGAGQTELNIVTPPFTGATLLSSITNPFADSGTDATLTGNYSSSVFRNTNGFLDFFYQINVTQTNAGITATNIGGFTPFNVQAAFSQANDIDGAAGAGNAGAFTAGGQRPFGSQKISGGTVAFAFNSNPLAGGGNSDGVLTTGQKSATLVIRTNATAFTTSNATVNGGAAANVTVLAPVVVVPEAGTLALLLPGFALGVVAITRRKK